MFNFFRFCDESCNTITCGYDAGDCGVSHFSRLYEIAFNYNASNAAFKLLIPKSTAIAYVNVSKVRFFIIFIRWFRVAFTVSECMIAINLLKHFK